MIEMIRYDYQRNELIRLITQDQSHDDGKSRHLEINQEKAISGQIYQQRFVFIECVQLVRVGDRISGKEATFVSLLKKQLVPTTTRVWSNDQRQ